MKDWKKIVVQSVVCIVLLCVIWGGYYFVDGMIALNKHRQITLCKDDFSWVYQVDSVESEGEIFTLRGFAFELEKDAIEGSFEIVLHDIESGENLFLDMDYVERADVNEYFLCQSDYRKSGFEASIKTKKMKKESNYEVLLRVSEEKTAYQTGTYISDGTIMYTNPVGYESLSVAGTDLEEIVENGILRVYRPDYGMYVYQYEGELYWIAEPEYGFVDGDTYVEYQLYTTQPDKLPIHRLENQWMWDNIGFLFSAREILDGNMGGYRVTKRALPLEYSIKQIETGNYDDDWIWHQYFRPYYEFR